MTRSFNVRHVAIHGHEVGYRLAGEGPAIVLLHGLAGSSATWKAVMPALAASHTVLAPDLLGHGTSAKPRGDYSLGAYASGVRDLMVALGVDRATFVGHSLGGGVAMQLAYQFPDRCERLVLVASGGLGKEVALLLRLASIPGSEYVLDLILNSRLHRVAGAAGGWLNRIGLRLDAKATDIWRSYTDLTSAAGRRAFVHTVRSVIDVEGQRVSARDRLYLAAAVPTLIVWGDRDAVIPVDHAYAAHELMPDSRLEIITGAGHFLTSERPQEFLAILEDFLATTAPAHVDEQALAAQLAAAANASSSRLMSGPCG